MKFDKTLIPDEILTLEQLAVWVITRLSEPSVSLRYREIERRTRERVVEFRLLTTAEDDVRFVFRGGLPLDPEHRSARQ